MRIHRITGYLGLEMTFKVNLVQSSAMGRDIFSSSRVLRTLYMYKRPQHCQKVMSGISPPTTNIKYW